jgi:acyl-coenzyme A thioesterase PaaI-like protein
MLEVLLSEQIKGIQDYYSDHFGQCYGCGRLNEQGLQLKTWWKGEKTVTRFVPRAYHTALPGYVYGGLLASLIDCHGTGSASLAFARDHNITLENFNAPRFVTASLKVDYHKPTPIDTTLEIVGTIDEIEGRKVVIGAELLARGQVCVTGKIITINVPEDFGR